MRNITSSTLALAAILAAACSGPSAPVGAKQSTLTAAQCMYFEVGGKDRICHKTGSAKNPYVMLKISEQACITAHTAHPGDYIATPTDPDCQGGGCLPEGAPWDSTLPCCHGLTVVGGVCTGTIDLCSDVTCTALDQCHVAGTCDPVTGTCSNPAAADGTTCNDGNACTTTDTCTAGACGGTGAPCQNGGTCANDGTTYTCTCPSGWTGTNCETQVIITCDWAPCVHGSCNDLDVGYSCDCVPGWTGTNCEIDINECASNPCVHGTCANVPGRYECTCDSGWTGDNCDVTACTPTTCAALGFTCGTTSDGCGGTLDCGTCGSGQSCSTSNVCVAAGYDCSTNNPCTPENAANGQIYFTASAGPSYFIQCTEWGECYQMRCPEGLVWDQTVMTCPPQ